MARREIERRRYFRIVLNAHPCTYQILQVGERPIPTEPKPCLILNIGGGGLRVEHGDDLPIRRGVVALFTFTLGGQNFALKGRFIRKFDDLQTFHYGIQYEEITDADRAALIRVLETMK